ncbi:hypothetical protein [Bacillus wiedmannii]|uniref:hypothetical protein n=1 Tax=Bacillus wiedmannii TaxID=1890302 RepID=UPI000BFC1CAA|nr:hypothetical protein [Bacillus wiedmannii]PHF91589.1 hypothetical protein COI45_22970 [Bacillus wiedmannii]
MPQSILMQKLLHFPTELPVATMEFNTGQGDRNSFKTEIRRLGLSEYTEEDIEKFQVIHPIGNSFEGKGYLEDGTAYELIAVSTDEVFNAFRTDDGYILFADSKKAIIEHGIKRLVSGTASFGEKRFHSDSISINLRDLKEELEQGALAQIKGGWWRDLQIADVEVAYLGGGTVTESQYWSNYEESEGIISALRLEIPNPLVNDEDPTLKVLLTKEGNLVVYKKITNEKSLLDIAIPLFNLAKKHLE